MSCRWYILRLSAYRDFMETQERARCQGVARSNNGQPIMVFTVDRANGREPVFGDGSNVGECATIPVHQLRKGKQNTFLGHLISQTVLERLQGAVLGGGGGFTN